MAQNEKLLARMREVEEQGRPDQVRWCEGSEEEYGEMVELQGMKERLEAAKG